VGRKEDKAGRQKRGPALNLQRKSKKKSGFRQKGQRRAPNDGRRGKQNCGVGCTSKSEGERRAHKEHDLKKMNRSPAKKI